MQSKPGELYDGQVTGLTNFGAFVKLSNGETGMVHISEVAYAFVKDITAYLTEGQDVRVKVLCVGENNKISLSIKQAEERPVRQKTFVPRRSDRSRDNAKYEAPSGGPMSFEDMMAKFKADSEEKMSDLKRSTDMSRSSRRSNKS